MKKITLDIVLPVYNEEKELEQNVEKLIHFVDGHMKKYDITIIIVDNASDDDTLKIAKQIEKKHARVISVHLHQKGRGRAVKEAWLKSKADFVSYMDIDLSSDLRHLPFMVHALTKGYDIAIGTRNAIASRVIGRSLLRTITSKMYIVLIKLFFFVNFTDAQCGFKVISYKTAQRLLPYVIDNEWFFDTELLILAEKCGMKIFEEPVRWVDNPGSTVRVLKTILGDLKGLYRLFIMRPWKYIRLK